VFRYTNLLLLPPPLLLLLFNPLKLFDIPPTRAAHGGEVTGYTPMRSPLQVHEGGTVYRHRSARPPRKRSPKRLIVLIEPKKWRGTTKIFFSALCAGPVPPTSKFVPAPQPRTQNTRLVKAIIVTSSSAMSQQAQHVTSRHVTTGQDKSRRVETRHGRGRLAT